MPPNCDLFISTLEPSGDQMAKRLAEALTDLDPSLSLSGIGGPLLKETKTHILFPMKELSIIGFVNVIKKLPTIYRRFQQASQFILESAPKAVIFIDAPDFHLRLAKSLRKKGYTGKIIQYVSPTIWAWRPSRLKTLIAYYDCVLSIYPFEKDLFAATPLQCLYVGNPVKEEWSERNADPHLLPNLPKNLIGAFPGSRTSEIQENIPLCLKAFQAFRRQEPEAALALSCCGNEDMIKQAVQQAGLTIGCDVFLIPRHLNHALMPQLKAAISKCGTISLELALHQVPSVVIYQASALNRFIAKYLFRLRLPHFSMVNILMQREVFPELIHEKPSSEQLAEALLSLYRETPARQSCLESCQSLHPLLGREKPSQNSAQAILDLICSTKSQPCSKSY
ncbi:MAG: lpxB [Chlamydiales bacterium]|jgi:lipid-A-disaccharide synthase|nr:lpxB [Chlamydiales bacterium]